MSRTSIKERNKAIRQAWEKEQQLVREGKGTRDWTKEQQQDILDPDKGKAYDDQGRAFEGQHMKSAAKYPEYQGDPNNIQFLTKEEHLEAHKGSWQNPTNWYYYPITKEFHDFGDGEIVPCKIIDLSDPVVTIEPLRQNDKTAVDEKASKRIGEEQAVSSAENEHVAHSRKATADSTNTESTASTKFSGFEKAFKSENGFIKRLKGVGRFIINHPVESLEIAGSVIAIGYETVTAFSGNRNKNNRTSTPNTGDRIIDSSKKDIATKVADIVEKATRAENDVSGHKQRYHTKDGVVWKDKAPYHRGGKDS